MQTALATASLAPVSATKLSDIFVAARPTVISRTELFRAFEADEGIFAVGDWATSFYKVVSGAVRTYRLLSDGRRQIDAFHLPGDIFGLEAGKEHRFNADAVTDVRLVVHRRVAPTLTGDDGALAHEVVTAVMRGLERAQDHMMLLGRKSAKERFASFLLSLSERMEHRGAAIDLPMSRADMADHLGLTVESVSRAVTQLEREGLIELPPNRRTVVLRNVAALNHLAE